ncbi:MAG: deoxyhypusine synthase family protein [Deltaproteobacteria bacterium]|nr:deoxyhypusine synthase family protein [Deltaproteobacteria bacterium]
MSEILDRRKLKIMPLANRDSKSNLGIILDPQSPPPPINSNQTEKINQAVKMIKRAKLNNAPVILIFGAHMIKNGLSKVMSGLMEMGFIDHLATNGAGTIHDWELAYQGKTEEDVKKYIEKGQFGIWEDTGFYLNLAITLGAAKGLGYGESIGEMIQNEYLVIPEKRQLEEQIKMALQDQEVSDTLAAKAALLHSLKLFKLKAGKIIVPHPHKDLSYQFHAKRLSVPLSVCPGIGYDIIYTHPLNNGASIGQGALWDFLSFAKSVSKLEKGVLISIGSAVMAPQITEKAMSMAKNLAITENRDLNDFDILVVDIQKGDWNWQTGEPPKEHPAYYLRFCKSFSRLGGRFSYIEMDNRDFLIHLYRQFIEP